MRSIAASALFILNSSLVASLDMKGYVKNTPDNGMVETLTTDIGTSSLDAGNTNSSISDTSRPQPRPYSDCVFSVDPLSIIGIGTPSDPRFSWDDYCYAALVAPAQTVTRTVVLTNYATTTVAPTITVAKAVTKTLIGVTAGTITELCPIPTTSSNCGVKGWGLASNNINSVTGFDGPACHQLCLETTNCASFQTGLTDTTPVCNLYSTDASANNTIPGDASPFTFYDRDCQDLAPGCVGGQRDLVSRDTNDNSAYGPPAWFLGLPIVEQYEICECIEDATYPIAGPTITAVVTKAVGATAVVTNPVTVSVTTTATVGGGTGFATVYTSVH